MKQPIILAVDTSCDDTSAAVTQGTVVLSNVIASQTQLHKPYGGVFPTVAKLAHRENIAPTIAMALRRARITLDQVDILAVTQGPGLAPALEVGIGHLKELALQTSKPLIPVNHLAGHVVSVLARPTAKTAVPTSVSKPASGQPARSIPDLQLPALAVIVSGGHTQFVLVPALGKYQILGSTLDDAAGECLDKIGRMLNLGYPAGPVIEEFAKSGDATAYPFPLPLTTVKTYDLSFSGMKTFARNLISELTKDQPLTKQQVFDLCASAQYGVFRHICYKLTKVLADPGIPEHGGIREIWLGGGVAANQTLRKMVRSTISEYNQALRKTSSQTAQRQQIQRFRTPYSKKLCADNAAMIGVAAGVEPTEAVQGVAVQTIERKPQLRLSQ